MGCSAVRLRSDLCCMRVAAARAARLTSLRCPAVAFRHTHAPRMATASAITYQFGPWTIPPTQVFYRGRHCLGLVNLSPVVPGHVLIITRRRVARFADLAEHEVSDVFLTAQKVSSTLEKYYNASSLTFAVQDGKDAGMTVPHFHLHIMPRRQGDFKKNDQVYEEIEKESRPKRTEEEMAAESKILAALFPQQLKE